MNIIETSIPSVLIIEPKHFPDERGFFLETYNHLRYEQHGVNALFVQDNHSRSKQRVLRGLHCQRQYSQGKLVYVTHGEVFDVAVDIRHGSPTFGQWVGAFLNDQNHHQLYIPPGFAHGFCVLSEIADFCYKCTDYYHPEDEIGVHCADPEINITWPIKNPIVSPKDSNYLYLKDIARNLLPKYK